MEDVLSPVEKFPNTFNRPLSALVGIAILGITGMLMVGIPHTFNAVTIDFVFVTIILVSICGFIPQKRTKSLAYAFETVLDLAEASVMRDQQIDDPIMKASKITQIDAIQQVEVYVTNRFGVRL